MTTAEAQQAAIFAQPRRLTGSANRALTSWQTTVATLLQENWRALLGTDITVTVGATDSARSGKAISQLDDPGYAGRLEIGPAQDITLFCMSTKLMIALVNDMLGTPSDTWPEERELTAVETSMAELLFGEVSRAISQAWPEVEPLACDLLSVIARPTRSRIYAPDAILARTKITVTTSMGEATVVWLISRTTLEGVGIGDAHEEETPAPAPQLKKLAEDIPVQITVRLGDTSMRLSELEHLRVGDYLTLEQSVSQPLEMTIDGRLHWLGHACRLGTRQGFEIIASRKG